ncbi:hypothetical protein D3C76_1619280 [compost metagenome]
MQRIAEQGAKRLRRRLMQRRFAHKPYAGGTILRRERLQQAGQLLRPDRHEPDSIWLETFRHQAGLRAEQRGIRLPAPRVYQRDNPVPAAAA